MITNCFDALLDFQSYGKLFLTLFASVLMVSVEEKIFGCPQSVILYLTSVAFLTVFYE
jgi:hypothetical protein